jgi:hypothetical protein
MAEKRGLREKNGAGSGKCANILGVRKWSKSLSLLAAKKHKMRKRLMIMMRCKGKWWVDEKFSAIYSANCAPCVSFVSEQRAFSDDEFNGLY